MIQGLLVTAALLMGLTAGGCSRKPVVLLDYPTSIRHMENGEMREISAVSVDGQYISREFRRIMKQVELQAKLHIEKADLHREMESHSWMELCFEQSIYVSLGQRVSDEEEHISRDGNDFRLLKDISNIVLMREGPYAGLLFFVSEYDDITVFEAPDFFIPEGLGKAEGTGKSLDE